MKREQQALLMKMQLGDIKNGARSRQRHRNVGYELYAGIGEIISKWSKQDMQVAAKSLCLTRSKSFDIFRKNLFPKDFDSIHAGYFIKKECSCEKLFIWYACLINQYVTVINKYISLRNQFEKAFIVGNYSEASTIIAKVESEFGLSVWGIDCRFAVYEYEGGLEANKAFLEKIVSSKANVFIKYCANFQSFKVEKNVNNRQYVHRIENVFEDASSDVAAFFRELLYPIQNLEDEDAKGILRLSLSLPLIDIYNAFIKTCIRLVASRNNQYREILQQSFNIIEGVDDVVFQKLKWAICGSYKQFNLSESDINLYTIGDLYTRGDYDKVIKKIDETEMLGNCFELYEYYVKSHIMANKELNISNGNSIRNQLICAMYSAYVKQKDVEQAHFIITKFLRLFSDSYLGTELAYFFADKFWEGLYPILEKGKILSANANNISLVLYDRLRSNEVFELYDRAANKNATYNLLRFLIYGENPEFVEKNQVRWYIIKRNLEEDNLSAIKDLEDWNDELKNIDMPYAVYQRERVVLELFKLYISLGEYLKAEILVAEICVDNPYAHLRIDLSLIKEAVFVKTKMWKSNICTPIVTYLYDREDFTAIYTATANFLRNNGISKPSELFGYEERFGEKKLMFFLKKVCVKEVLDSMYNAFDTDDDVENERIEICKYLQAHDKKNASTYIEEISRILQNRKVRKGVKYFEDVKIDINFDRIFDSHKNAFHENYKRFKEMERLNGNYAAYDVKNGLWIFNLNNDPQTYSHTFLAFKELFEDYRQEVTFEKFGLDSILGSRIRHGILQNQIRVVFGNNNIIFVSKSSGDGIVYVCPSEIENICSQLPKEERDVVFNLLSNFSKEVDEYTDVIVKNYIRICVDDKNPQGIFNFSYNMDYLQVLMLVAKDMQNENLLREYFDGIWLSKIEYGIEQAKKLIQGEIKNTFISMLKRLEEEVTLKVESSRAKDYFLDGISKSRTELQQSMDCISEWFKLPEEQKMENYSAEYLVETCDYINRRVVSNFDSIQINSRIEVENIFKGKTFSYMVDIFIILYTNAFYHSGYIENLNLLTIDLLLVEKDTELVLEMKNNLSSEIDRDELVNIVIEIQEKLEICISSGEYYNYEGKSGYIKICKILNYNLECANSYLQFGLMQDKNHYFTRIVMPKSVLAEKERK